MFQWVSDAGSLDFTIHGLVHGGDSEEAHCGR